MIIHEEADDYEDAMTNIEREGVQLENSGVTRDMLETTGTHIGPIEKAEPLQI